MHSVIDERPDESPRLAGANAVEPPNLWTDEERDIADFQAYLRSLSPEALWDVHGHVDAELFPRRFETVEREMNRRRLFYVSPYSPTEQRLRSLCLWCVGLTLFAAILQAVGRAVIETDPGQQLPWFVDLAIAAPAVARMVLPLARFAAVVSSGASSFALALSIIMLVRRRLRLDVLATTVLAALLTLCLT